MRGEREALSLAGTSYRRGRLSRGSGLWVDFPLICKDVVLKSKLLSLAVCVVALACSGCGGKADKDFAPPPPSENVDSPPPGGMQENPGQPRP